jgi:hypothetical protein
VANFTNVLKIHYRHTSSQLFSCPSWWSPPNIQEVPSIIRVSQQRVANHRHSHFETRLAHLQILAEDGRIRLFWPLTWTKPRHREAIDKRPSSTRGITSDRWHRCTVMGTCQEPDDPHYRASSLTDAMSKKSSSFSGGGSARRATSRTRESLRACQARTYHFRPRRVSTTPFNDIRSAHGIEKCGTLLANNRHHNRTVPRAHVAFQKKDLLPRSQQQFALNNWNGPRRSWAKSPCRCEWPLPSWQETDGVGMNRNPHHCS